MLNWSNAVFCDPSDLGTTLCQVLLGLQPEVSQCAGIDDNCDLHNKILILSQKYTCDPCYLVNNLLQTFGHADL